MMIIVDKKLKRWSLLKCKERLHWMTENIKLNPRQRPKIWGFLKTTAGYGSSQSYSGIINKALIFQTVQFQKNNIGLSNPKHKEPQSSQTKIPSRICSFNFATVIDTLKPFRKQFEKEPMYVTSGSWCFWEASGHGIGGWEIIGGDEGRGYENCNEKPKMFSFIMYNVSLKISQQKLEEDRMQWCGDPK